MARKKEKGFTKISNEILEQTAKVKLNGTQFKIIMIVWRFTDGFQRESHELSVSFISNAIQSDVRTVKREINKLIELNIIKVVREATFNTTRIISFNKDYNRWLAISHVGGNYSPDDKSSKKVVGNQFKSGGQLPTQERKLNKGLKKDVESEEENRPYKEIIDHLNNKTNAKYRHTTKATQRLIGARLNEGYTLNDFKKVIDIKADDWLNDKKMSMYLRPETLFNGTKFESYLNQRAEPSNKTITYESHTLDDYDIPKPKENIFD